jgi:hypothetical protein
MRRLNEQAKIDQGNAATDIDWSRPLPDLEGLRDFPRRRISMNHGTLSGWVGTVN